MEELSEVHRTLTNESIIIAAEDWNRCRHWLFFGSIFLLLDSLYNGDFQHFPGAYFTKNRRTHYGGDMLSPDCCQ